MRGSLEASQAQGGSRAEAGESQVKVMTVTVISVLQVSSEMTMSRYDPEYHISPHWGRHKEIKWSLRLWLFSFLKFLLWNFSHIYDGRESRRNFSVPVTQFYLVINTWPLLFHLYIHRPYSLLPSWIILQQIQDIIFHP